jgi:hypothetical protein
MKVIYRISDSGYKKIKPYYVNNRNVFLHFLTVFKDHDIYLFADNISEETYSFLTNHMDAKKIIRTSLSNAGSFMYSLKYAMDHFQDNDKVYFAEDDYIYTNNAPSIIEEGLDLGEYSSGYDHPDKYINHSEGGPNPFIAEGGELTRVLVSKSSHWKYTNSCCMTFATTVKTLKEDLSIFQKYCSGTHPHDFQLFCELIQSKKRKLVSSIPGVSTHGEIMWLSKFVDWEKVFWESLAPLNIIVSDTTMNQD